MSKPRTKVDLASGKILFDPEDLALLQTYSWYDNGRYILANRWDAGGGYNRSIYLHRLLMDFPSNQRVAHINGNYFDNRRCNLRVMVSKPHSRLRGAITACRPVWCNACGYQQPWYLPLALKNVHWVCPRCRGLGVAYLYPKQGSADLCDQNVTVAASPL